MPSLLSALFGSSDPKPASPKMNDIPALTHIRANLEEQFVSALDAMHYMQPGMQDQDIYAKINSLPRAAIILAFWPPNRECSVRSDCQFKAVSFDNIHLLLEGTASQADLVQAAAEDFVADIHFAAADIGNYKPMILVTDAKITAAQRRYQRDIRDRLLNAEKYYTLKKARDAKFRERRRADKNRQPLKQLKLILCDECAFPDNEHFHNCSKSVKDGQD